MGAGIQGLGKLVSAINPMIIGFAAAALVIRKVVKGIMEATDAARDFQEQMAEVSTLLSDDIMKVMPELEATVLSLSEKFGKSTDDMTKATYQAISAGVNAREVGKFLVVAGKLAVGGVTDMETAVDGLTSIVNAYGMRIEDATRVSDAMFVAMRAGKTTVGELSGAIGRVAPIAAQMGISIEEVLAMTATLTKGGLDTAMAVTGIRAAMVEVMKASPQFKKVAQRFGIDFREATVQQMGFSRWLVQVNKQIVSQGGKLSDLFRNVRSLTAVLSLAGKQQETQIEIMRQMGEATGETETAFAKMTETLKFAQEQAKTARRVFQIEMGQMFVPMATNIAKTKTKAYRSARAWTQTWKKEFGKPMTAVLGRIAAAFGITFAKAGERMTMLQRVGKVTVRVMRQMVWIVDKITLGIEWLAYQIGRLADRGKKMVDDFLRPFAFRIRMAIAFIKILAVEFRFTVAKIGIEAAKLKARVMGGLSAAEGAAFEVAGTALEAARVGKIRVIAEELAGIQQRVAAGVYAAQDMANKEAEGRKRAEGPQGVIVENTEPIETKAAETPEEYVHQEFFRQFAASR